MPESLEHRIAREEQALLRVRERLTRLHTAAVVAGASPVAEALANALFGLGPVQRHVQSAHHAAGEGG